MSYKTLDHITISDIETHEIPSDIAHKIHQKLTQIIHDYGPSSPQTWLNITKQLLNPQLPFSFHQMMYYGCYKDFGPDPPAWLPTMESARLTNIGQLLERRGKEFLGPKYEDPMSSFSDFQKFSVSNPEVYWKCIFEEMGLSFTKPPHCILYENSSRPGGQWLPGCSLNPAEICLSLNAKRNLDSIAVLWRNEGEDHMPVNKMTLEELRREVWLVAHALDALGLPRGSAIVIDMPMNVDSVIIYLGEPKAIPWTHATPLKAAADAWCHMDIRKGDVVCWPTNLGWMMGPWLVYASLLNNASIALYNGSPLSSGFSKLVQDANVTMLGVVPSIVRAWRSTNCTAGYDWSAIRCFGSTGEASSADEYLWLMGRACYKPVIEYCGGTEIGGGFITGSLLQPQVLAAFSTPAMGCSLFLLDNSGTPMPQNMPGFGELALGPLMFGASHTLLNGDHDKVYFKGMPTWKGKVLRRHGDVFERTTTGYYRAHGRADDTMNLGGIKVSSIEIERICNLVDSSILETAAFGVPPSGGGPEQLVIAVVFKDTSKSMPDLNHLKMCFNSALQKQLNPLFRVNFLPSFGHLISSYLVSRVVSLSSLPRTATNKIMRRVLRQQITQPVATSKL
ncbi:putative acyl-activating enzyme 17 peroxisomal [Bienertia sinuspersici]